jgi:hypothetical protein
MAALDRTAPRRRNRSRRSPHTPRVARHLVLVRDAPLVCPSCGSEKPFGAIPYQQSFEDDLPPLAA